MTLSGLRALAAAACTLFATVGFATGNDGNFSGHAGALVDYRQVVLGRADIACKQLVKSFIGAARVLAAEAIVASGDDPDYCHVVGAIAPAIRFVAYLPTPWNGRLYMHGNGGDAGEPLHHKPYHRLRLNALRNGFAAAFTNTGHDAATEPGAVWAHDDPVREADYGFRAVHVTATAVKDLLHAYYGEPVHHAYFDGCSTGGRQGLMEAQRYPEDFDGILAGAPVFDLPDMLWQYRKNSLAVKKTPISRERLAQLGEFIRARYDAADGIEDGVIGDPLAVDFLPSRDLPHADFSPGGFTTGELRALDAVYAPVLADGREVYLRAVTGSELPGQVYQDGDRNQVRMESAWVGRVVSDAAGQMIQPLILESWFRYPAFDEDDPARDWQRMEPARDWRNMERMRGILRAADPDLSEFEGRGGKLLLYHGWADFGVNPLRTIRYVEQVAAMSPRPVDEFLRLYLVPGMFHCSGGVNVDHFDLMTPLIDWVEAGQVPGAIPANRIEYGNVTRTRPLCPYPTAARYNGRGDINHSGSFDCTRSPVPDP